MNTKLILQNNISSAVDPLTFVAKKIKMARNLRRIPIKTMANNLGISRNQMSNYEKAKCNITVTRLWEIANLLDVDLHFFIDDICLQKNCLKNDDWEIIHMFGNIKDQQVKDSLRNFLKVL